MKAAPLPFAHQGLLALTLAPILLVCSLLAAGATPTEEEAGAIAFFKNRGDRITLDAKGHAVKLFSSGNPEIPVPDLRRIGHLTHLQELSLNNAKAGDGDWAFLQKLKSLKKLRIWHGHRISSLAPFAGVAAEDILFGGCMGLRDLNKDDPDKLRNVALTLRDLPNVKVLSLYHSPLTPDDSHLVHIAKEFPNLSDLRVDFAAPRGQETNITPAGLAALAKLKLTRLTLENSEPFTPDHFAALAKIDSLKSLLIYPPRSGDFDHAPLLADLKKLRPELEISIFQRPG